MKTKTSHQTVLSPMPVSIAFLLILTNLLVIDYLVVKNQTNPSYVLGDATTSAASQCPQACLAAINRITGITATKEYFVPLGAGTNATDDWADVGAQAYIDTRQYQRIKQVVFEATLQVPTGNEFAYVRLFNVTDKHPVWYSEISMNGTGPTVLTSNPISLDSGNKLYSVQMKTQLKFVANLLQARVHITTY